MIKMKADMVAVLVMETEGLTRAFGVLGAAMNSLCAALFSTNQREETTMFNARPARPNLNANDEGEAHRHAYNAAFEKLGLAWHWDTATFTSLREQGRDGVRTYLQTERPHLLRAYDADFLVEAIETAKTNCYAGMVRSRGQRPAWSALPMSSTASRLAA